MGFCWNFNENLLLLGIEHEKLKLQKRAFFAKLLTFESKVVSGSFN